MLIDEEGHALEQTASQNTKVYPSAATDVEEISSLQNLADTESAKIELKGDTQLVVRSDTLNSSSHKPGLESENIDVYANAKLYGVFSGRNVEQSSTNRMENLSSPTAQIILSGSDSIDSYPVFEDTWIYCAVLVVSMKESQNESPIAGPSRWNASTRVALANKLKDRAQSSTDEKYTVKMTLCEQTHTTQVFGEKVQMRFHCGQEQFSRASLTLHGQILAGVRQHKGYFEANVRPIVMRLLKELNTHTASKQSTSIKQTDNGSDTEIRRFPIAHGSETMDVGTVEIEFRVVQMSQETPPRTGFGAIMRPIDSAESDGGNSTDDEQVAMPIEVSYSSKKISSIEQIEDYSTISWGLVQSLNLQNNEFMEISPLTFRLPITHHLRDIDLSHNNIKALALDAFASCPRLETLDLSNNDISRIGDGLLLSEHNGSSSSTHAIQTKALRHLTSLNLSNNRLQNIRGLESLRSVRTLNLSSNRLANLMAVRLLSLNTALTHLWLLENPLASRRYRAQVSSLLPFLQVLDDKETPRNTMKMRAAASAAQSQSLINKNARDNPCFTTVSNRINNISAESISSINIQSTRRLPQRYANSASFQGTRPARTLSTTTKRLGRDSYSNSTIRNTEAMRRLLRPSGISKRCHQLRSSKGARWISIRVRSAQNIYNADGHAADPYITLRHRKIIRQTDTQHGVINPSWESSSALHNSAPNISMSPILTLQVKPTDKTFNLEVTAWDEDRRRGDVMLGRTIVQVCFQNVMFI